MGKPRMIILVRHAQSEGNKNRDIHQIIPDHRVKLTAEGWNQADEAGRRLRSMLKPDDTVQFFTSPYRRTRETTEGILRSLTSDDPTPSPFPRNQVKVYEEPRLREQDFGNFQPCSAEMERMWQERADYGHFFYRIPNGESAADAYDRISGFNESLWRSFGEADFPSVCVLVTHGLMTRVFLMKWYHWSVEYFEDLRNVNHCEFIIMKQNPTSGRYVLENELRTWSELKRRAAAQTPSPSSGISTASARAAAGSTNVGGSPTIPARRWGGCVNGCDHDKVHWPRRAMRKNTAEFLGGQPLPAQAIAPANNFDGENGEQRIASQEANHAPTIKEPTPIKLSRKPSTKLAAIPALPLTPASPNDASNDETSGSEEGGIGSSDNEKVHIRSNPAPRTAAIMRHLEPPTPAEGFSDDSDYFPGMQRIHHHHYSHTHSKSKHRASSRQRQHSQDRKAVARRLSEKSWMDESGMGTGARADALGDGDADVTSDDAALGETTESPTKMDPEKAILREALKGDMIVEKSEDEREDEKAGFKVLEADGKKLSEEDIEKMKIEERKGFDEVY